MLREMGMGETALGVDSQNPSGALRLYQSFGYREARRHTFFEKAMAEEDTRRADRDARM
jgi:ribosomal protein S18 acetylase RimI-like enzyme